MKIPIGCCPYKKIARLCDGGGESSIPEIHTSLFRVARVSAPQARSTRKSKRLFERKKHSKNLIWWGRRVGEEKQLITVFRKPKPPKARSRRSEFIERRATTMRRWWGIFNSRDTHVTLSSGACICSTSTEY